MCVSVSRCSVGWKVTVLSQKIFGCKYVGVMSYPSSQSSVKKLYRLRYVKHARTLNTLLPNRLVPRCLARAHAHAHAHTHTRFNYSRLGAGARFIIGLTPCLQLEIKFKYLLTCSNTVYNIRLTSWYQLATTYRTQDNDYQAYIRPRSTNEQFIPQRP